MSNNLNNNFHNLRLEINKDEYWDFFLNKDSMDLFHLNDGLQEKCLISYIDTNDPDSILFENLYSNKKYTWRDAICDNVDLKNIGYVGMDNGYIHFKKDRITNEEFLKLFTDSNLHIDKDNNFLHLRQITGNTQEWEYPSSIIGNGKYRTIKLNGGFYQGFFKLFGHKYQILPSVLESDWVFEFTINKRNFEKESEKTLNDKHPDNKGIFFFMGTRAENKWWYLYEKNKDLLPEERCDLQYFSDDYVEKEYETKNGDLLNGEYLQNDNDYIEPPIKPYFLDDYLQDDDYSNICKCPECKTENFKCGDIALNTTHYFSDDYLKDDEYTNLEHQNNYLIEGDYISPDVFIDENKLPQTKDGYDLNKGNIFEIETDNKFLLFNHTKTGFTVDTFDEDVEYVLTGQTPTHKENFYTLFNHTKTGYTVNNIGELTDNLNNIYNVYDDIIGNAFAFRVKDDGSVGYRYMVLDCNNPKKYGIIEEYSLPGMVIDDEWVTIDVRIKALNKHDSNKCPPKHKRRVKLYFYVNGQLKFISKELPEFEFKELNDLKEKQEGVPYNISIGGGTQGLCDMIMLNYYKLPKYILPLEKYFGGTFIGEFKSFKFYDCSLNYPEIVNNVEFEKNSLK